MQGGSAVTTTRDNPARTAAVARLRAFAARGPILVAGLGVSGLAVARYLAARGLPCTVLDTRAEPPGLDTLRDELPAIEVRRGAFDADSFTRAGLVVLSPGLDPNLPAVTAARAAGVAIEGEIELFAHEALAPVVAVTGSNGKSTVTSLLARMAANAGCAVRVGGNLAPAALDLLGDEEPDLYVLELSSFQLETTSTLRPRAATVLNLSPDHLDRHPDIEAYAGAKARVFNGDGIQVLNRDDARVARMAVSGRRQLRFGLDEPWGADDFGLRTHDGEAWLARGSESLLPLSAMRLRGRHNAANALAALALGSAIELPLAAMLGALREFGGLAHRCQLVTEHEAVRWYDDSKGTNVGATAAAIEGLGGAGDLVLIAGGDGKGQDFSPLAGAARGRLRAVVLIGRDGPRIGAVLEAIAPVHTATDMRDAVRIARTLARRGDSVLLSPACASFDMFQNYIQRGEMFAAAVRDELAP